MSDNAVTAETDPIAVAEFGPDASLRRVRRYRVLGVLTLLFVLVWAGYTWYVFKYIKELESMRVISQFFAQGMSGGIRTAEDQAATERMIYATGVTAAVRHTWRVVMGVTGLVMAIGGLMAAFGSRRSRGWLLAAGFSILLGTIGTLAGIVVLIKMADFPATITPIAYAILTLGQSAFGWILILFCRRPGRTP